MGLAAHCGFLVILGSECQRRVTRPTRKRCSSKVPPLKDGGRTEISHWWIGAEGWSQPGSPLPWVPVSSSPCLLAKGLLLAPALQNGHFPDYLGRVPTC